jgi:hypothetical protein
MLQTELLDAAESAVARGAIASLTREVPPWAHSPR